ncbi:MAG: hypothetical protein K8R53_05130, partial [Bacteroidales bacterium]|nr:hypothetical protein [Bacteroidales bacterium]
QNGQYSFPSIFEGLHTIKVYAQDYATIIQDINVTQQNTVFDFQLQPSIAWSFELGSFEPQWSTGGSAPWYVTTDNPYEGAYCTRSGNIGNNQFSELSISLELTSGGSISFARKVSSEANYDYLEFYIDNVLQDKWAGEIGWGEVSFSVTSGLHEFKWIYDKDVYVSNGSDCAWIDYIIFPPYNSNPVLQVTSVTVDDAATGNGNGQLDPGESASLIVDLINNGLGQSNMTSSTLTSSNVFTSITSSTFPLGNIPSLSTAQATFDITIDPAIPSGTIIDFTLLLQSLEITSAEEFYQIVGNIQVDEDFETGDFSKFDWGFSGNGDWIITSSNPYQGSFSAKSGSISHNQSSGLEITMHVILDGTISFFRQVSSEAGYDYLNFYIDNDLKEQWSGNVGWNLESYPVTAGEHTFKWIYVKDQNTASGSDCGWVDMIEFPDVVVFEEIDLKVFLQGPFSGNEMTTNLNTGGFVPLSQPYNLSPWNYNQGIEVSAIPNPEIVDWILVELRETTGNASTATSSTIISKQVAFILKNGQITTLNGTDIIKHYGVINNNLYAVIYHRNHLAVMSSGPLQKSGGIYSWDFSTGANQVHGGSIAHSHLGNGVYGLSSGDGNADGQVGTGDKNDIWIIQAGSNGYESGDFDLDTNVGNGDKIDQWIPNSGKGTQVPN